MKSNRRKFIQYTGMASLALLLDQTTWGKNLRNAIHDYQDTDPKLLAEEEDFWHYVQQAYTASSSIINLNNGGVSPSPIIVQEAMKRYHDMSNEAPSYYMWRQLDMGREPLRKRLAELAGVDPEEIALHRNATESLETIIFGLKLKAGDEIILSKYDYPNMINAWKQREERDGIKLVWADPKLPSTDDTYLAQTYIDLMNVRTKLVHITHIINWNGQILPVRTIADAAQAKGIEVLVDGAHSFAHFQYKIPDLNCHYFGTSLHKWLSASIGTGMMYVRKDKIASLYPLFGSEPASKNDIRKYEALGTRPFFIEQATQKAIDFFEMIGAERKEKRLFYLKEYWTKQVRDIPELNMLSPINPEHSCAIATISFNDRKHEELESFLMDQARIHTVGINWHRIQGVRVTPNVYTSTKNLDRLVEAIHSFAKK